MTFLFCISEWICTVAAILIAGSGIIMLFRVVYQLAGQVELFPERLCSELGHDSQIGS